MELQCNEVSCIKNETGDNFASGLQDYVFSIGKPNSLIMSASYFRIKLTLTVNNRAPLVSDGIALAENCCANMFNQVIFKAGGQDISSMMQHAPQGAQCRQRLNTSSSWGDSVGKSAFMLEPDFRERQKYTSLKPVTVGMGDAATTVAIAANGVTTSAGTAATVFNDPVGLLEAGDVLIVGGVDYNILSITDATHVVVDNPTGAIIAATANWHIVKQADYEEYQGRNTIYVIWRPQIGIFSYEGHLGSGDYRMSMNPNPLFKKAAVQTLRSMQIGGGEGEFNLNVDEIKFYACTEKKIIPDQTLPMELHEAEVHSKTATSVSSWQFNLPVSTKAISVFFQANESGSDTRFPPSLFKLMNGSEKKMSSIQLTYANIVHPNTMWNGEYQSTYGTGHNPTNLKNELQQRYVDTYREAGMLDMAAGCESYKNFLKRGMLVHYSFTRDKDNLSTTFQLQANFVGGNGSLPPNSKVFVVAFYSKLVDITTSGGQVVQVNTLTR